MSVRYRLSYDRLERSHTLRYLLISIMYRHENMGFRKIIMISCDKIEHADYLGHPWFLLIASTLALINLKIYWNHSSGRTIISRFWARKIYKFIAWDDTIQSPNCRCEIHFHRCFISTNFVFINFFPNDLFHI